MGVQVAETEISVWYPAPGPGKLVGVLLMVGLGLPAAFALFQLIVSDLLLARIIWGIVLTGLVVAILVVGYLLRGLASIRYVLTPYHLRVEWQRETLVVPYSGMEAAIYRREQPVRLPVREPYWPGFYVSAIDTADGSWRAIATTRPRQRVRIVTRTGTVAISPDRPIRFLNELEQRRRAALSETEETGREPVEYEPVPTAVDQPEPADSGPAPASQPETVPSRAGVADGDVEPESQPVQPTARSWDYAYRRLFRTELLGDRFSSDSVALGVIILVLLTIYTVYSIDNQFEPLPIHWNADGEPDQFVRPRGLWLFPLMAGVVLAINTALATLAVTVDRFAARLLVGATPVAQLVIAVALWEAVH